MHARLVRLKGSPEGAEERAAIFQREALPVIREQPGFAGVVTLGEAGGAGAVVVYWESEEAMAASRDTLAALRERMTTGQGLEVLSIEEYEVTLMERPEGTSPQPGNAVRLTRARGNPEAAQAAVTELRDETLAMVRSLSGFKALIAGIDRSSGRFYVVSGWKTPADRDASEAPTAERRARLAEIAGATDIEVDRYEITFADLRAEVRP